MDPNADAEDELLIAADWFGPDAVAVRVPSDPGRWG